MPRTSDRLYTSPKLADPNYLGDEHYSVAMLYRSIRYPTLGQLILAEFHEAQAIWQWSKAERKSPC